MVGGLVRGNSSNLDLLRSLAVLTVMIDHLIPTLVHHGIAPPDVVQKFFEHVGHAGVLAFFVHTSLVLMYSLERLPAQDRRLGVALRFYVRRFFRIYPLAIVCVVGVLVLGLPDKTWGLPTEPTVLEIVANLLLVQNLLTGHSILVPLWSLPYEVQMYVVLPILYWIARRTDGVRWLIIILAASYIGAYIFRKLEHGHMNLAAYVPCFLVGVLCYPLRDRVKPFLPGWLWVPVVIGLFATYCWIHMISWRTIYWLGWSLCLVLGAAILAFRDGGNRTLNAAGKTIATYSYGIYLLHVPALHVIFNVWAPGSLPLAIAAWVALTGVLAVAAYHLLEAPMVNLGRRASESRAT